MISAPAKNHRDHRDISGFWRAAWRVTAELIEMVQYEVCWAFVIMMRKEPSCKWPHMDWFGWASSEAPRFIIIARQRDIVILEVVIKTGLRFRSDKLIFQE
jgi:hypothetical protein